MQQSDWGKVVGLKQGTVSDIEREREGATVSNHVKNIIYDKFHVNKNWLEEGTPPMFSDTKNNTPPPIVSSTEEALRKRIQQLEEQNSKLTEQLIEVVKKLK